MFYLQSLSTNGGTDRGAFGSVAALSAHPFPLLPRDRPPPPSYSISRSQIVASSPDVHGLSRKRSHSGESLSAQSAGTPPRISFAAPLVSFAPPASLGGTSMPPSAKRLRREPLSPTSVGDVSDTRKLPPAKTAVAATPGTAQMQSMLRGLQHLSTCGANGCSNPLCVSTRAFVDKVKVHRASMAGKATHDENKCGACKLWGAIVKAHAPTCCAGATCRVPGCSPQE
ncbi:hypothetical protein PHYSODRAFT_471396 [Phytophthora sojae]|uniref:Uncharacterized protein n=1 Tax=Phytophthora sojae (strain P6497) TaxID=1094619 RepID=G4YFF1_PHYSP|nr:hypothetical protein PHYSODRAFT_471396 [Phytophthora sojae]EGZ26510.1 hypothetical protein PHYSODRAFT_471396 [Phytophthora sojae]|eukprot:XP_009513785.1 hypothetical protein PHYSODRAFT_471396 [Phytophthora sojae]